MNPSAIDENKNYLTIAKCHSYAMDSPNSLSFDVSRNSTNYLSCSCTQIQPFENGITKFIESKYEAFEFAPAFETTCLNIIQPESIGFQGTEGSTFHFNRERASNKKLTKEDLPTFGFPIMATDILLFSSELFFSGKYLYISSNKSPVP